MCDTRQDGTVRDILCLYLFLPCCAGRRLPSSPAFCLSALPLPAACALLGISLPAFSTLFPGRTAFLPVQPYLMLPASHDLLPAGMPPAPCSMVYPPYFQVASRFPMACPGETACWFGVSSTSLLVIERPYKPPHWQAEKRRKNVLNALSP